MNHIRETDEGFGRYQSLREKGYSKEEALRESSKDLVMMIASTKIDDKLLKNNKVDERLFSRNDIKRKVDSQKIRWYNGKKLGKQEAARLQSAVMTYKPNAKVYVSQILDNENGDPAIGYDIYIKNDGSWLILGKYGGQIFMKGKNIRMLTENEKRLIEAIVDAGFEDDSTMHEIMMGMDDKQMAKMAEYLERETRKKGMVTEESAIKARFIILGYIDEDFDDE